jgi:hypothetical protein
VRKDSIIPIRFANNLTAILFALAILPCAYLHAADRWTLNGDEPIAWYVSADSNLPHEDHIEMSGHRVSTVVFFGADKDGVPTLHRQVIWPMLRTIPNDTRGSLGRDYAVLPELRLAGATTDLPQTLTRVSFDGLLKLDATTPQGLQISRVIFPSTDLPAVLENWTVKNPGDAIKFDVISPDVSETTPAARGVYGSYVLSARVDKPGEVSLGPGESASFSFIISGRRSDEPELKIDPDQEEARRRALVARISDALQLQTPDPVLDRMFALSKLRTSESVFATKAGLMHSPGGGLDGKKPRGRYYAAIWANDQAEYAGPFFPFEGYPDADEASLNAYRLFAGYMNSDFKPIPSSIVAEATGTWHGAGDRGDDAMIAYGAARFSLARGDREIAEQLWPLVQWTLEYCRRQLNANGVVASHRDELEGRLPSGDANLHTSVLTYDALISAADLARSLGKPESVAIDYEKQAADLRAAIDKFFAAKVQGFDTYRYYDGDDVLRAWICSPLCAGIMERKQGTIAALTSPLLWSADGLTTAAGRDDFWDRSTLYALRGMFIANEPDWALKYLDLYSDRRLLGEHVPYAVEANPEGNQSHLAAESALYARIVTEGLFGIRPTGLNSFTCQPELPSDWPSMSLRSIRAFNSEFDLTVERSADKLRLTVTDQSGATQVKACTPGQSVKIEFPARD